MCGEVAGDYVASVGVLAALLVFVLDERKREFTRTPRRLKSKLEEFGREGFCEGLTSEVYRWFGYVDR